MKYIELCPYAGKHKSEFKTINNNYALRTYKKIDKVDINELTCQVLRSPIEINAHEKRQRHQDTEDSSWRRQVLSKSTFLVNHNSYVSACVTGSIFTGF